MILAFEDTNSKLVDIVTVTNVDDEDRVGNSLFQIWELRIFHEAKLLFRLWIGLDWIDCRVLVFPPLLGLFTD